MRNWILIGLLSMLLISCDKDIPEIVHLDYILAGDRYMLGVNYMDIDPDFLLVHEDFTSGQVETKKYIDINSDGIDDFVFSTYSSHSPSHNRDNNTIIPLNNNAISVLRQDTLLVDTLMLNQRIDSDLNWNKSYGILFNYFFLDFQDPVTSGLWCCNSKSNFIGIKIIQNDSIIYGWIRMEITENRRIKIMEYAYTNGVIEQNN